MPSTSAKSGFRITREISLGMILQLAAFTVSGIFYVARVENRVDELLREQKEMHQEIREITRNVGRVEKYLSSKDPEFWQKIRAFEEEK